MHLSLAVEQRLGCMLCKIKVGQDIEIYTLFCCTGEQHKIFWNAKLCLISATERRNIIVILCHKEKHSINLAKAKQMADHRARSEITKQRISMTNAKIRHALWSHYKASHMGVDNSTEIQGLWIESATESQH